MLACSTAFFGKCFENALLSKERAKIDGNASGTLLPLCCYTKVVNCNKSSKLQKNAQILKHTRLQNPRRITTRLIWHLQSGGHWINIVLEHLESLTMTLSATLSHVRYYIKGDLEYCGSWPTSEPRKHFWRTTALYYCHCVRCARWLSKTGAFVPMKTTFKSRLNV